MMTPTFEFRLIIEGPDTSRVFIIPEGRTIIGRQSGVDIHLEHPQISRMHASLDCTNLDCHLTDLNSSNGSQVNDEVLKPEIPFRLSPNDQIIIGPFTLKVDQIQEDTDQPPTKELPVKPSAPVVSVGKAPHPLDQEPKPEVKEDTHSKSPPPPVPPKPQQSLIGDSDGESKVPPWLTIHSSRLINYLPDIYHTDFMSRFLALFESISMPIEWTIDHFDLFLSPRTVPSAFLPWLANWFDMVFDPTWSEAQRRQLLGQAHVIFSRRGTKWALSKVLEIYTGHTPEISDQDDDLAPFTFVITLPISQKETHPNLLETIININKPAHTIYELKYNKN